METMSAEAAISCVFCRIIRGELTPEVIASRDSQTAVFPSRRQQPRNRGHMLVVPEDEQVSFKRKRHTAKFKFEVALKAAKDQKTVAELASEHQLHPSQISQWKRQLLEEGEQLFHSDLSRQERNQALLETDLYEQIGRLKMELEWLKKKLPTEVEAKRDLVEWNQPELSIRRQCELIGLNRASY